MHISSAPPLSVRAAFDALVDYAGLFPPAQLPLAEAASEYDKERARAHAWMLARFIVPASLLSDAAASFKARFSVIVDPKVEALHDVATVRCSGANVEALEVPLAKTVSPGREQLSADEILDAIGALEADLSVEGLRDIAVFLEVPRSEPWIGALQPTLETLARFGLRAKIRCGGVTAEAFPSVEELATFVSSAHAANVAFKATAGLHHPVRHRDRATGFMMHGFLNVLAAAALVPAVDAATLRAIVGEEEPAAFGFDGGSFWWRERRVSAGELKQTRAHRFLGFGSCSFSEPVDDLIALGILPAQ
jgi:hypothetical protein